MTDSDYQRSEPDFEVFPTQEPALMYDVGELAARIGAPYVSWRSGKVLYISGFECNRNDWTLYLPPLGAGNGDIVHFTGESVSGGKQCCRGMGTLQMIANDVLDPATNTYRTSAIKLLPAMWSGNLCLQVTLGADENVEYAIIHFGYDSNGITRNAGVGLDFTTKSIYWMDTDAWGVPWANFTFLGNWFGEWRSQPGVSTRWGVLRLMISSDLTEYLGLWVNREFYDGIVGQTIPTGVYPVTAFERLSVNINVMTTAADDAEMFVDDVVVTQDEYEPEEIA